MSFFPLTRQLDPAPAPLPQGWPSLASQREYWERKEQEWVGCNGGENDHLFTTNEDEYYDKD